MTRFTRIFALSLVALSLTVPGMARSHEFWIDAQEYQVPAGGQLVARFRNGENFEGMTLAFFPNRSLRYAVIMDGAETEVAPRMGDNPALDIPAPGEGLAVAIHETAPSSLTYDRWEKFEVFANHKDFPEIRARHQARGLPETGFAESYTRHAKALIAIADGQGADSVTGMQTEFVALANPYTDDLGAGLPVQLFYKGAPRGDAQVEIFDRAPDGIVTVTLTRTDAGGRATIPVSSGHSYLLDAVVLREAPPDSPAVWETLWAALTFAVP